MQGPLDLESLLRRMGEACERITGVSAVEFYDLEHDGVSFPPFFGTTGAPGLLRRAPLIRWMRVNRAIAEFPQDRDILAGSPSVELTFVENAPVRAALPLVDGERLVGVLLLIDARTEWALDQAARLELLGVAQRWAREWINLRRLASAMERGRKEQRSQQLSLAGELAASAAHEIRNPLTVIRSWAQLLRDSDDALPEHGRILCEVIDEVDRVDKTVSELLELSRHNRAAMTTVDLADLVAQTASFIQPYARQRSVAIEVPALPKNVLVHGDHWELRRVLTNLLLNACQACDTGGIVSVNVAALKPGTSPAEAEVTIRDNGCGIAADVLDRVFEPFFTTKPKGTGLGLAVSRESIQRHGGDITIQSAQGVGTEVWVRLPCR